MSQEQHSEDTLTQQSEDNIRSLILHNDDVNTFDFVIESLVEICDHDPIQAEQCALTVHFKGKCEVKTGSYQELQKPYNQLQSRQLSVTIN